VLWVYGLLQCGEAKRNEMHTSMSERDSIPFISLDGNKDQLVRSFLGHGYGRPGLTMKSQVFCELSKPRSVMAVARQVFEGNCPCPCPEDSLPPMIQNLCELIGDLGNLP
jgi:hypothetical protein